MTITKGRATTVRGTQAMTVRGSEGRGGARAIPRGVWMLGFVSLLMDTSSEMIHALLPVYLVTTLGMSALTVGFVEGHRRGNRLVWHEYSLMRRHLPMK
jgi:hypothetical protein